VSTRATLPAASDRLALGPLSVSPICVGMVGEPAVVPAAFAAGVNFFFVSADMHWPRYEATRQGLRALLAGGVRRDDIVVAAVSYMTQPEFCTRPFAEVLEELPELERLDVLLAGGAYGDELTGRWPIYERHRDQRRHGALAVGATFHDRAACARQLAAGRVDVAFARYNARHPGAREDLFPAVAEARAPLFTFKSTSGWVPPARLAELGLSEEHWAPTIADHYRFALSDVRVDGLLVGPARVGQVQALLEALAEGPLDEDEQEHLVHLGGLDRGQYELTG
jgi:hypothetical protein